MVGEDAATQRLVYLTRGVMTRSGAGTGAPAKYIPGPDPDAAEEEPLPEEDTPANEEGPTPQANTPDAPPRQEGDTGGKTAPPEGE